MFNSKIIATEKVSYLTALLLSGSVYSVIDVLEFYIECMKNDTVRREKSRQATSRLQLNIFFICQKTSPVLPNKNTGVILIILQSLFQSWTDFHALTPASN